MVDTDVSHEVEKRLDALEQRVAALEPETEPIEVEESDADEEYE
jgi:tetrahydromethanopterin S-methyltransferase subunit G